MLRLINASAMVMGAVLLMTATAYADTVSFTATMSGGSEIPAKLTGGQGSVTASLDTDSKVLTYTVQYSNLTGPATAAHFHGPADTTGNAPVVVKFDSAASPITGSTTLSDSQVADLMNGMWYANVHTSQNPGGEIRGQMQQQQQSSQ